MTKLIVIFGHVITLDAMSFFAAAVWAIICFAIIGLLFADVLQILLDNTERKSTDDILDGK
jgi:hypothetical protein